MYLTKLINLNNIGNDTHADLKRAQKVISEVICGKEDGFALLLVLIDPGPPSLHVSICYCSCVGKPEVGCTLAGRTIIEPQASSGPT
jgi:hypothetical protein